MNQFWDQNSLDFNDELNQVIWRESPSHQKEIQHPNELQAPGSIGAQQAMIGPMPFSWVPDIVGKEWKSPLSIFVVGSAYAGFVKEYSTRPHAMPLAEYSLQDMKDFQSKFLERVVMPDNAYYGPIKTLLEPFIPLANAVIFDLCRVSFVRRGNEIERIDVSGDNIVTEAPQTYQSYAESANSIDWTWKRLTGGKGKIILALGSIAEHGLLRLFHRQGMKIYLDGSDTSFAPLTFQNGSWVKYYGDPKRPLYSWVKEKKWWCIRGAVKGADREYLILPVYHPASRPSPKNPGYEATTDVIRYMIEAK